MGLALYDARGYWDLVYELANHHENGFDDDFDDIVQHRIRASRSQSFGNGWYFSVFGQGHIYDDENAWTVGLNLEKSFGW